MHPDPPKQLETIKIKNPIRFNKPSPPNIPTSIRTHPNLPNRCNHVKYAQINKTYQIQQNLCKSTRIVLNPAETTNIYPNTTKPNSIVKLQRNPFTYMSINVHGTHRSSNHKIARFRQLHKQLQITQNSQQLI